MISIEEQKNLLIDIARKLKKEINAFAIGGTAMMFYGLKDSTKDIDLVFENLDDRAEFIKAARAIGWTFLNPEIVYDAKPNKPIMLKFGDFRLDLFINRVIDFDFSASMQKRAEKIREFQKNLIIKIADIHDIILMKCATGRVKDIDDVIAVIKNTEIRFGIPIEEAKAQLLLGNERAILELGNFFEKLQKIGINIPNKVLDELWELLVKQRKEKKVSK